MGERHAASLRTIVMLVNRHIPLMSFGGKCRFAKVMVRDRSSSCQPTTSSRDENEMIFTMPPNIGC